VTARLRSLFDNRQDAALRGLIAVVAVALAWHTWATWGDIQVDCGRELYVPQEILRGKLLYRDIFYPYGPLAPYVGALLILTFGPHLLVFYLFGIAVAIGCAILLLEIGTMLEGRGVGLTAALALLFMGFSPGIFNYVFPYSYGASLGLLLSLLCALFTIRHLFDRPGYNLLLAGFAASLTLLCKQEFGIACYLMLAFVIVVEAIVLRRSMHSLLQGIMACIPGVALWFAIYGWFFWTLTPGFMVDANWVGLPGTSMHAYGAVLYPGIGQRFIPHEMMVLAIWAALCLTLWFLIARAGRGLRNLLLAIILAIAVAYRFDSLVLAANLVVALMVFPVGMYFIGGGFLAYATYQLFRASSRRRLAEAAVCILALIPAIRVFAAIRPYGYNIYLAMPLFLVFAVTMSQTIKAAGSALSEAGRRGLINCLFATEIVMLAFVCIPRTNARLVTLETSWGAIHLAPEEADVTRQILAFISAQKSEGQQVAMLPEATMLYALTGTEAPGRWYMVVPGILSPGQEAVLIADLSRTAPAYILMTTRNTHEYGADYFGIDYDQNIYHWIESNYRVAGEFGRFRRDGSGSILAALVYQRRNPVERNSIGTTIPNHPG
jgi:hypothetical protein